MTGSALVLTLVIGVILKVLPATIPTKDGKSLLGKFQIHSKLNEETSTITIDGKAVEDQVKKQVIHDFNEASFLKQHYIFPGNEHLFLHPENAETPLVIQSKKGKKEIQLFLYSYSEHVDVVKKNKNKVVAYSLRSEALQKLPALKN